jgi:hypothetical protein
VSHPTGGSAKPDWNLYLPRPSRGAPIVVMFPMKQEIIANCKRMFTLERSRSVVVAQPGRGLGRDISRGEATEKELDALIERRSRKREIDPDEREELWKESVRRYNARRREENRVAWCDYFCHLAGSLRARAEEYDQRAQTLMKGELEC